MKAEKDIEKQLLDAEAAWEGTPPPALWDQLEQRLDADLPPSARKPKNWPFRILALIPPIAVAVALLWPSDSVPAVARSFAHHRVQIGAVGHALEPALAALEPDGDAASADPKAEPNTLPAAIKPGNPSNGGAQAVYNTSVIQNLVTPITTNPANMYNGRPDLEMQNYILPAGNLLVTNGNGNPIDTVSSITQYHQLYPNAFENNRVLQINAQRNDLNFNLVGVVDRQAQEDLQHLKWLLGSWRKQGTSGAGMEDWRQLDEFTLLGRGFFVVNGDTVITQEMRIEQRGPNVYYIVAMGQDSKPMRFRLRSRNNNEVIFQGDSPKNRKELVLRNNPSTQEVETILQSPDQGDEGKSARSAQSPAPTKQVMKRSQ